MKQISINQAKPNPTGKDRFGSVTPPAQLAGEWVDFKNTGSENYNLGGLALQHIAYTSSYPNGIWDEIMTFSGNLESGKVVRVHSGGEIPTNTLKIEDLVGADFHLFTGENYKWNNANGDSPRLVFKQNGQSIQVDKATYSANPAEGKILKRSGDYLV